MFSLAAIFIGANVKAQTTEKNISTRDAFEVSQISGNYIMVFNNAYDGIKGTPYLNSSWSKGSLLMISGVRYEDMALKYDMMEDNVLVKTESGKTIFPNQGDVRSFNYLDSLGNEHWFYDLGLSQEGRLAELKGFFELLYQGKSSLYVKRGKHLEHIESKGAYSSNKSYDEFRDNQLEYVLVNKESEVIGFKQGKKNVLTALDDEGVMAEYAKKNKLNLKKEKDIIALVTYFYSK